MLVFGGEVGERFVLYSNLALAGALASDGVKVAAGAEAPISLTCCNSTTRAPGGVIVLVVVEGTSFQASVAVARATAARRSGLFGVAIALEERMAGAPFSMVCSATSTPMAFSSAMAFVEIVMAEIEVPVAMVDGSVTLVLAVVAEVEAPVVCVVNRPTAVVLMSAQVAEVEMLVAVVDAKVTVVLVPVVCEVVVWVAAVAAPVIVVNNAAAAVLVASVEGSVIVVDGRITVSGLLVALLHISAVTQIVLAAVAEVEVLVPVVDCEEVLDVGTGIFVAVTDDSVDIVRVAVAGAVVGGVSGTIVVAVNTSAAVVLAAVTGVEVTVACVVGEPAAGVLVSAQVAEVEIPVAMVDESVTAVQIAVVGIKLPVRVADDKLTVVLVPVVREVEVWAAVVVVPVIALDVAVVAVLSVVVEAPIIMVDSSVALVDVPAALLDISAVVKVVLAAVEEVEVLAPWIDGSMLPMDDVVAVTKGEVSVVATAVALK